MFNIGNLIKQFLLSNSDIVTKFNNKVYNLMVVDEAGLINAPYLVIIIESITPNYTKDIFIHNEAVFTISLLAKKYQDLINLSELVKSVLEFKSISDDKIKIENIEFIDYKEAIEDTVNLYTSDIQFKSIITNKN